MGRGKGEGGRGKGKSIGYRATLFRWKITLVYSKWGDPISNLGAPLVLVGM